MAVPEKGALRPHRHPAKRLPFELVQHVTIFFEEKLHTQALGLLLNVLTTDSKASTPIIIPSPQHLALAATFLVHPSTTGRPKTNEEEEAPSVSLRLLRLVNNLVGPINAQFGRAFAFRHFETSRHGGRRHFDDSTTNGLAANGEKRLDLDKDIDIDLANSASVWSRAEDFWHAVGWAFNCAVLHPARWEHWRNWLEFMCEVLEEDWDERWRRREEDPSHNDRILKESMVFQYITNSNAGFGRNRRILRSVFADGTASSANEFREVFHRELKLSQKKASKEKESRKRGAAVNIDAEEYGDFYLRSDEEEEDGSSGRESKRPRRERATRSTRKTAAAAATPTSNPTTDSRTTPDPTHASSLLGDATSLALRQRLIHLLSTVSQFFPKDFMDLQDLYHFLVEFIRPLPLPIYQAFISPLALPYFSPAAHSTLAEYILFNLRETSAPQTDDEYLTQAKLEKCFLPYATASSSLSDNVKMSLALEALIILLADSNMLHVTEKTKRLTSQGIIRRAQNAQHEGRKNQVARMSEDMEWSWLGESAERLTFLVEEVIPTIDSAGVSAKGSSFSSPAPGP
ncbi:uncharacterized protein BDV17DRAFT_253720 [Aspergillus undulatus]|uniref:uncharacterized protein n=1 Tax=Aspergillus undulatus TaxID=1810928 RepID=UPI003CCDD98F